MQSLAWICNLAVTSNDMWFIIVGITLMNLLAFSFFLFLSLCNTLQSNQKKDTRETTVIMRYCRVVIITRLPRLRLARADDKRKVTNEFFPDCLPPHLALM